MSPKARRSLPLTVARWALPTGHRLPRGSAPLGVATTVPFDDGLVDGDALWFDPAALSGDAPTSLAAALPDPATARLVVIGPFAVDPASQPFVRGLLARLLDRPARVPRAVRGSALLLRGYRDVQGGLDPVSGLDLCWARG